MNYSMMAGLPYPQVQVSDKKEIGVSWSTLSLFDGLSETLSGLGGSSDRLNNIRFEPPPAVGQQEVEWAIEFDGVFERFINAPVEDVLAEGVDFEYLPEEEEDAAEAFLKKIKFWPTIFKALSVSRSNYGAMVWIDTGAKDNAKPMAKNEIFKLKRLVVFDSEVISGQYTDGSIYSEPELWSVGDAKVNGKFIHRSRLLHFPGKFISDRHRHEHGGHGARAADQIWEAWIAFRATFLMPPNIALTYEEGILGLEGLNQKMTSEAGRDLMRKKVTDLEAVRSFLRIRVMDSLDSFQRAGAPVAGLADIMDRAENFFVAQTGFPRSILFGYSKGSNLAADSKGEEQNKLYMRLIRSIQHRITPELEYFFGLIQPQLQRLNPGMKFENMQFCWEKSDTETPLERAQRQEIEAKRDSIYFSNGVGPVSHDELREDLKKRGIYSSLDVQDMPSAEVDLNEDGQPESS